MNFKELTVWQKAITLVNEVYEVTKKFPKAEVYALASQMQRAAVSIPSNIAERHPRNHKAEFVQFLGIALGSSAELETQVYIAQKQYPDFEYKRILALLDGVQRMLNVLISKVTGLRFDRWANYCFTHPSYLSPHSYETKSSGAF